MKKRNSIRTIRKNFSLPIDVALKLEQLSEKSKKSQSLILANLIKGVENV